MRDIRKHVWVGLACLGAFGATGCGRNLRSFDQVQKGFDHPTGSVTSTTAATIFDKGLQTDSSANAASFSSNFDTTGKLKAGLSAMSNGLAQGLAALTQGCSTNVQLAQGLEPKSISVSCTKNPDISGSMDIEFDYTGSTVTATFVDFSNWCASGTCLDGSLGFEFTSSPAAGEPGMTQKLLATARVTVKNTSSGQSTSLDWAFRDLTSASATSVEWLVYSNQNGDAKSWVLSASVSDSGGDLSVRGANGTFACHYDAHAAAGTCKASNGSSWAWSGMKL